MLSRTAGAPDDRDLAPALGLGGPDRHRGRSTLGGLSGWTGPEGPGGRSGLGGPDRDRGPSTLGGRGPHILCPGTIGWAGRARGASGPVAPETVRPTGWALRPATCCPMPVRRPPTALITYVGPTTTARDCGPAGGRTRIILGSCRTPTAGEDPVDLHAQAQGLMDRAGQNRPVPACGLSGVWFTVDKLRSKNTHHGGVQP